MHLVVKLALSGLALLLSRFLWSFLASPLNVFPGPTVARVTNLWRLLDVFKGRCDITHNALHRQHGPAVRMGPNVVSLADPAILGRVYSTKEPWTKSDMYNVNDSLVAGERRKNIFSHQDEDWHTRYLRPVKNLYSMSRAQDMEPGIDKTINLFLDKVRERFVGTGQRCEMSDYVNYFAWDVMNQITFSENLGMLETGTDNHDILYTSAKSLDYFAAICQIPPLDMWLDKNPIVRVGPPAFAWTVQFSIAAYQKRLTEGRPQQDNDHIDFLDRFVEAKGKNPNLVDDNVVVMYLLANVTAGSDTTASTMSATVYYTLKNPAVHRRLRQELVDANLTIPPSYQDVRGLRYLDAVIQEATRLHPGVGLMCERIVPKGGFTLPDGRFIPEGTIVGMNPWVINRDTIVFGADTDSFIPERWLPSKGESDADFQARLTRMKNTNFTFGAGSRTCLGRYVSLLETYKFIASLFVEFNMELAEPEKEWKITNSWFVRQSDFPVTIKEAAQ